MVYQSLDSALQDLSQQYEVLSTVYLDTCFDKTYAEAHDWLRQTCQQLRKESYQAHQRLIFVLQHGDYYVKDSRVGLILRNLQVVLNEVDISNCFVILVSSSPELHNDLASVNQISSDPTTLTGISVEGKWQKIVLDKHPTSHQEAYQYGSLNPIKINLHDLSAREKFLLTESKVFCIYPWTHLHAWPTGQAFPCCMSEPVGQIGDTKTQSLTEIWNSEGMRQLRTNMLNEQASAACTRCYEQENSGFFSGRKSANKHHGHRINLINETDTDGSLEKFEMTYWDIRFSNLCNLRCRSCGHIFSSQWYRDQAKLAGAEWAKRTQVLNYAGKTETDIWEQLESHLDYVEQIYFAGGEPLLMEEHYLILDALEKRQKFDVRLIYNTNFTHTDLKGRSVFDYWKKFHSVAVGASLDGMGPQGEYIRKGTVWSQVEHNRKQMLEICPQVDFYISPTLSIMNALHLPDFHRNWVERGFIRAQDLNVNILQDPEFYRIDIAPAAYKQKIQDKLLRHLDWLKPQDQLERATVGFESALNFMSATDNSALLPKFWNKTRQLDDIRKENILEVLPELGALA